MDTYFWIIPHGFEHRNVEFCNITAVLLFLCNHRLHIWSRHFKLARLAHLINQGCIPWGLVESHKAQTSPHPEKREKKPICHIISDYSCENSQ